MEKFVDGVVSFVDFALVLTRPLSELLIDFLYRIIFAKRTLPPILNKILLMSATKLARKIRRREVSAVEVMNAYIGRIGGVQPALNACVDNRFEEALSDARAVDDLLRDGKESEAELEARQPLLGVPFSCKETIGVKDLAQTFGLKSLKHRKAPVDSDTAALYRKAGAIPVVVTNVPTLALWWDTYNPAFGTTCNPYDTNRSAGGSSGGEAALIAAAGSVIGIGNDLAGSVRLPASMCGIYGHKPSRGVISNVTPAPVSEPAIDPFISTGPMCRYAEDLHLLVGVLSGEDRDRLRLDEEVNFRNVKVYYMEKLPGFLLSATRDIKAAVRKAAKHFEDEYHITPEPVELKELAHAFQIWQSKVFEAAGAFATAAMAGGKGKKFNLWWEYIRSTFGSSDYDYRNLYFTAIELPKSEAYYEKCLGMFENVEQKLVGLLRGEAILILPVLPEHPPFSGLTIPKCKKIGYTGIFNVLGLPGTAVPAGTSPYGLPIGLQVIAARGNDRLTLSAAVELDKVFGGWQSPSSIIV